MLEWSSPDPDPDPGIGKMLIIRILSTGKRLNLVRTDYQILIARIN